MNLTGTQAEGLKHIASLRAPPYQHDKAVAQLGMAAPICDLPDVPKMIVEAKAKATTLERLETLSKFIEFYKTTSIIERKHLVIAMMDYDGTGDVSGLEDYACALTASQQDETPICGQCNGSGEGQYEGTRCMRCKGSGGAK